MNEINIVLTGLFGILWVNNLIYLGSIGQDIFPLLWQGAVTVICGFYLSTLPEGD